MNLGGRPNGCFAAYNRLALAPFTRTHATRQYGSFVLAPLHAGGPRRIPSVETVRTRSLNVGHTRIRSTQALASIGAHVGKHFLNGQIYALIELSLINPLRELTQNMLGHTELHHTEQ